MTTGASTTRRKSFLVTEALDIIDQDQSGDLGKEEVETLLAAMGLKGQDVENVLRIVFDKVSATTHTRVTDAILMMTNVSEGELETMLGRVVLFQKAFRKIDVNGNSKLSLNEIMWMMESLDIDKKLAADLMAGGGSAQPMFGWILGKLGLRAAGNGPRVLWIFELIFLLQPAKVRKGRNIIIVRNADRIPEKGPMVIVRKQAKDAEKALQAKVRTDKSFIITRKVARNPEATLFASKISKINAPRKAKPRSRQCVYVWREEAFPVRTPSQPKVPATLALPRPSGEAVAGILKSAKGEKPSDVPEKPEKQEKRVPRMGRRGSIMATMFNGLHSLKLGGRPAKSKTITLEEPVDESTGRGCHLDPLHESGGAAQGSLGAAFFAQALNDFTTTIVDEEQDWLVWNVLSATFSLIWSMAEMLVCVVAALVAAVKMIRICGIMLVPMDKERAMLAGSLARAALELGHPKVRTFGPLVRGGPGGPVDDLGG
eukprot:g258.t1